jgi:hypothetical protein
MNITLFEIEIQCVFVHPRHPLSVRYRLYQPLWLIKREMEILFKLINIAVFHIHGKVYNCVRGLTPTGGHSAINSRTLISIVIRALSPQLLRLNSWFLKWQREKSELDTSHFSLLLNSQSLKSYKYSKFTQKMRPKIMPKKVHISTNRSLENELRRPKL